MSEYFNKIVARTASEKAAFESSKSELQNQVSCAVMNAASDITLDAWRLRERKHSTGFVRI